MEFLSKYKKTCIKELKENDGKSMFYILYKDINYTYFKRGDKYYVDNGIFVVSMKNNKFIKHFGDEV